MKTYKYIFIICAVLGILGGVMSMLHVNMGIMSGRLLYNLALLFIAGYQSWLISKLYKQLKDKEKTDSV